MVCREFERRYVGTLERMLGLARLVQANKYLTPAARRAFLDEFGRISPDQVATT
jgi:hypothetical protein